MKPFIKLEKLGKTLNKECYIEMKTGMPKKFKVPKVKITSVNEDEPDQSNP